MGAGHEHGHGRPGDGARRALAGALALTLGFMGVEVAVGLWSGLRPGFGTQAKTDGKSGICVPSCNPSVACPSGYSCDETQSVCVPASNPNKAGDDSGQSSGCAVAGPVRPVPWIVGVGLVALGVVLRRRRR